MIFQADKAGELIHRIETEDHDTIDEIEMFSLQMANEEVEFSAAGFFPVNYTLVFSVRGLKESVNLLEDVVFRLLGVLQRTS